MIEQFTEEEIQIIRNELKALDLQNEDKPKPHYLYKNEMGDLFADRPDCKGVVDRVSKAISKICDLATDCMRIDYLDHYNRYRYWTSDLVPCEISDEYYQMYGEIVDIIKKHTKPYERFKGISPYERIKKRKRG